MSGFAPTLKWLRRLFARRPREAQRTCDTCAFVEFLRSNGDGQVTRLHAFCRCPAGPYADRPVPPARQCAHWVRAERPPHRPTVGDPTLTA